MRILDWVKRGSGEHQDDLTGSGVIQNHKPTVSEHKAKYRRPASFVDFLPWVEYLPDSQFILLDDGRSVGAVLDITPAPTEGFDADHLESKRNVIQDALQDSFDEDAEAPWICQQYVYDDDSVQEIIDRMRSYPSKEVRNTELTQDYLNVMEAHLRGISKKEGIFFDDVVTDCPWGMRVRRNKLVIYRRLPAGWRSHKAMTPIEELRDAIEKLTSSLRDAGVSVRLNTGKEIYGWFMAMFNPAPPATDGDREKFLSMAEYPGEADLPAGNDFAENLFFELPRSDAQTQTWWFDDMPHRVIRVNKLRRPPRVGMVTGENASGADNKSNCMFDRMPPGAMLCITTVMTPQSKVEEHLNMLADKSRGDSTEAAYARRDVEITRELMANKQKIWSVSMAVFLRATDLKELRTQSNQVAGLLLNNQLAPVREEDESIGLDAYLTNLPMAFDPSLDKKYRSLRPTFSQHLVNMSMFLGRNTGTGNSGITMFNRGGEPLVWDSLSPADCTKNQHFNLIGPSGSGKSNTLGYWSWSNLAMHRPEMYIIEAGDSFGLYAKYWRSKGLTVNQIQIKPGSGVSLAPFIDANELLKDEQALSKATDIQDELDVGVFIQSAMDSLDIVGDFNLLSETDQKRVRHEATVLAVQASMAPEEDEGFGDEQRNIMGECETIALLMITGGEASETQAMTRADRRMVRDGILKGARLAEAQGRRCRTSDVCEGLKEISQDESYPEHRRHRAFEMSESMRLFTDGFEGELFDQDREPFPKADVTIIDLAVLAREGYSAHLALAVSAIVARVNSRAEATQHSSRRICLYCDEGHLLMQNPLVAPLVNKIIKLWRKLGASFGLISQSVHDVPESCKSLLNTIEWWVALVMPPDEVEAIARFKKLSNAQKNLMLSTRKAPKKFTEGVVLGGKFEALFRNVPPSLALQLAATEKEEKAQRARLMREFGISEVEAAVHLAKQIDFFRGIGDEPEPPQMEPQAMVSGM